MPAARMRFETPHGARYLAQLCKHFAHKVAVDFSDTSGRAALPSGPALMSADELGLTVTIEAADIPGIECGKHVISDHLRRFALREAPAEFVWTEDVTSNVHNADQHIRVR